MRHRAFCHEELQPERRFAGGEEPELLARGIPEARCHHLASCGGKQHARGHGAHGGSRLCVSAAFRAGQNGEGQRHAPRRRHTFDHASLCGNESHEARLQGCPRSSGA